MKVKLLLAIIFIIELTIGSLWIRCQKLADGFYFSNLDSQLKLEEAIRNDVGYSTYLARFLHNKLNIYGIELVNKYLQFWDIRFDVLFFSIIGCFGIICGFWYVIKNRNGKYKTWLILVILLLLPFIEIENISIPYWLRISIILLPYYSFSLYGIWQFIKSHKLSGFIITFILLILTIWYTIVFQNDIFNNFCYN